MLSDPDDRFQIPLELTAFLGSLAERKYAAEREN
jgi:hypothetical protein